VSKAAEGEEGRRTMETYLISSVVLQQSRYKVPKCSVENASLGPFIRADNRVENKSSDFRRLRLFAEVVGGSFL